MKATSAPSAMAARTTPAPIPREPPVISIFLLSRRDIDRALVCARVQSCRARNRRVTAYHDPHAHAVLRTGLDVAPDLLFFADNLEVPPRDDRGERGTHLIVLEHRRALVNGAHGNGPHDACRDLVPKQLAACCQTAVSRSRVRRDVAVGKQQRLHCPATLVHQTPRSPPNITCRDRIERNIEHCFVSVNGLARLPSLGVAPRDLNSPSRAATVVGTELRRQKMAFAMVTCAIEYPQGPQSCEAGKG